MMILQTEFEACGYQDILKENVNLRQLLDICMISEML